MEKLRSNCKDGGEVTLLMCDVSSPQECLGLVEQLVAKMPCVDVLVHNAGVMLTGKEDVIERTLATNVVSNVVLTDALIPMLRKSRDPRVIFVASGGALTETLRTSFEEYAEGDVDGTTLYARTKRMQIALGHMYARKFPDIFFASMHPGWADTPGVRTAMPEFFQFYQKTFRTAEQGADTISWLAYCEKPASNGAFWRDRAVELEHFWMGGTSYPESQETALYEWLQARGKA